MEGGREGGVKSGWDRGSSNTEVANSTEEVSDESNRIKTATQASILQSAVSVLIRIIIMRILLAKYGHAAGDQQNETSSLKR